MVNYTERLPEFLGYTIDFQLKQFRKVDRKKFKIEFIDFDSRKGLVLLTEYYKKLV